MIYTYNKPEGFLYNLTQKISIVLEIPIDSIELSFVVEKLNIKINVDLTEEQKKKLDEIMNGHACSPMLNGSVFIIRDLWGMRRWFKKELGMDFNIWMENDAEGEEDCFLYLQFPQRLSKKQAEKVLMVYRNSIWELK